MTLFLLTSLSSVLYTKGMYDVYDYLKARTYDGSPQLSLQDMDIAAKLDITNSIVQPRIAEPTEDIDGFLMITNKPACSASTAEEKAVLYISEIVDEIRMHLMEIRELERTRAWWNRNGSRIQEHLVKIQQLERILDKRIKMLQITHTLN